MCKHIISYRLRSDLPSQAPAMVMLDTDADLERQLSSLRASAEVMKLTVFTATTKLERVPSWVEKVIEEDPPVAVEPAELEIVGKPGTVTPPLPRSTDG